MPLAPLNGHYYYYVNERATSEGKSYVDDKPEGPKEGANPERRIIILDSIIILGHVKL